MASLSDSCLDPTSQQIDYCHLQIRKLRVMEAKNTPHSHPGGRWQNPKAKGWTERWLRGSYRGAMFGY